MDTNKTLPIANSIPSETEVLRLKRLLRYLSPPLVCLLLKLQHETNISPVDCYLVENKMTRKLDFDSDFVKKSLHEMREELFPVVLDA